MALAAVVLAWLVSAPGAAVCRAGDADRRGRRADPGVGAPGHAACRAAEAVSPD